MKKAKDLLIVEMSSSALKVTSSEEKDYVLEGVFGQIDQKNRNNRIYTEDEYVPQIEALQQKIESSKLLGELDHPQQFDTSLKNVSHIVEELFYDKESKEVRGRIRLLDTECGRQAKALVDAGVPLQISSRAAGAVESNGKVKIKQLFTYDLVADPGFENAELKRVNESYGFGNDTGVYIYEMGEANITENIETQNTNIEIKENKNMEEFVKAEDFNRYSEYLAKEIKGIKESMDAKSADASEDMTVENIKSHNNHIADNVNTLSEYVTYLAEKLDQSIQYSEHVAEKADQGITYTEEVAEKLDQGIQYSEHLAESITKVKDFANYLAENHNEGADSTANMLGYVEYLRENLQSISEYAEYIAESINENLVVEDGAGVDAEDMEDETTDETPDVIDGDGEEYEKAADRAEDNSDELEAEIEDGEEGAKEVTEDEGEEAGKEVEEIEDDAAEELEEDKAEEIEDDINAKGEVEDLDDKVEDTEEEVENAEDHVVEMDEEDDVVTTGEEVEAEEVEAEGEEAAEEVEEMEEMHDEEAEGEESTEEVEESEEGAKDLEEIEGEEVEAGDNSKEGDVDAHEAGEEAEDLESDLDNSDQKIPPTGNTDEVEAGEGEEEAEGEDAASDPLEAYKNEISSKLNNLIETAQIKENENPSFFRVVSGSTIEKYNALNEDAKTEVRNAVSKRGFMTEREITSIIESSQLIVENKNAEPFFLAAMPLEYKETWTNLSEAKQNQVAAQSKYHTLNTEYQVRNFWQTRDLRETKVDLAKVAMVNESKTENKPTLGYDAGIYAEAMKKRFEK
jgi:hypothetical protein|tara:strand:+ start:1072 stop:3465 length:2394 start_codon:yes stop_codon:yes gene_type:complete